MIIPNIWENKKWQPNHQPVIYTSHVWRQKGGGLFLAVPHDFNSASGTSTPVTGLHPIRSDGWMRKGGNIYGFIMVYLEVRYARIWFLIFSFSSKICHFHTQISEITRKVHSKHMPDMHLQNNKKTHIKNKRTEKKQQKNTGLIPKKIDNFVPVQQTCWVQLGDEKKSATWGPGQFGNPCWRWAFSKKKGRIILTYFNTDYIISYYKLLSLRLNKHMFPIFGGLLLVFQNNINRRTNVRCPIFLHQNSW